ncbi:hypothetical protein G7070_09690 [Propioniciclava coleopterorum]|uniref:DUF695 domain-containing protein n=1 Tax=Propioniciclava coleopterorum TaxID=2714937 RepID=A0A6G7Y794_9ACTN|nr:hypothetical protein [Propioniciclava coleopterorum]QIK72487.1 hypothetical protein G7070_09690 [Propioniciclava coleopterorum]
MTPFGRKPRPASPLDSFWAWWATAGGSLDPTSPGPWVEDLAERVRAIHPGLTWEFGPGARAQHRLTLSAAGDAAARAAAQRWYDAAPEQGPRWEFAPTKTPDPAPLASRLRLGDATLDLAETVFEARTDPREERVHVGVFHPAFPGLDEHTRGQIAFLVVDWLLGEDAVERWVGRLDLLVVPPARPASGEDVAAAVAALAAANVPDSWVMYEGEREGAPVRVICRAGVRWVDVPTFDTHHLIAVAYEAGPDGLPAAARNVENIQAFSERLSDAVGGEGIHLGRELWNGVAVFHTYVDGTTDAGERVAAVARGVGVPDEVAADPGWSEVRHITG